MGRVKEYLQLNNNVIFRNGLMIMTRMDWNIDL